MALLQKDETIEAVKRRAAEEKAEEEGMGERLPPVQAPRTVALPGSMGMVSSRLSCILAFLLTGIVRVGEGGGVMIAEYDIDCSQNLLINFGTSRKISKEFSVEPLKVACKTKVNVV